MKVEVTITLNDAKNTTLSGVTDEKVVEGMKLQLTKENGVISLTDELYGSNIIPVRSILHIIAKAPQNN